jgi:hypothetical protein
VDWLDGLTTDDYDVARVVIQRGVALVYLLAFANVVAQFRPLLGERGLLPVPEYARRTGFARAPSVFHWRYSDRLVAAVGWTGVALAVAGLVGGFDAVPLPVATLAWVVMWALYLSVVNVGQIFYGFGWESLLLEVGLCVALLGNATVATPIVTIVLLRWILFRVEFGAGMIKMRGDRCWRDLTCLEYHHETQPMPGPTSRWFHLRRRWFHRMETAANHGVQLGAPWLLFLPQPVAAVGGATMIVTQAYLMLSGNYAWLNLLTLVLGVAAIPDSWFAAIGIEVGAQPATSAWFTVAVAVYAAVVVALSWRPLRNMFSATQRMNASFDRLHLVNAYGAFGSVTRERLEVVVEGSDDGGTWHAYEFKGKPTDPRRRPRQYAPYHLRLDWLLWFVALSPRYGAGWFQRFVERLLEADPPTLRLLAGDPFGGRPPTSIRVRLVPYRFTTRAERRASGQFWSTGPSQTLIGPMSRRQ